MFHGENVGPETLDITSGRGLGLVKLKELAEINESPFGSLRESPGGRR